MRSFRFINFKGREICFLPIPSIAALGLRCGASYFGLKEASPILPFGGRACFFFKNYGSAYKFIVILEKLGFDRKADLWEIRKLYKNGTYYHLVYFPVMEWVGKQTLLRRFSSLVNRYKSIVGNSF